MTKRQKRKIAGAIILGTPVAWVFMYLLYHLIVLVGLLSVIKSILTVVLLFTSAQVGVNLLFGEHPLHPFVKDDPDEM
jgi:hypothetical protein